MKVDRRKQRTQKLLRKSLIALILEKGYDAITVQDITDHANLGRATFYLHYHDKDELLLSLMEEILGDFVEQSSPLPKLDLNGAQEPSGLVFEHAEANADLYRAILGGGGLAGVLSHYRKYSAEQVQSQLQEVLPSGQSTIPVEIIAQFLVGAMNALVIWWLENNRPYSAEYMANVFHQLITTGLLNVLNTDSEASHVSENKEL